MLQERAVHREDAGVCVGRHRCGSCGNIVSVVCLQASSLMAASYSQC